MGWSYYVIDGRECGYSVEAECDHEGCGKKINRGLAYLCGENFDKGCGRYFCADHRYTHNCDFQEDEDRIGAGNADSQAMVGGAQRAE